MPIDILANLLASIDWQLFGFCLLGFFNCCCAPPPQAKCVRYTDGFDRADSDALGGNWVEEVGNASIVSGRMRITTPNTRAVVQGLGLVPQQQHQISVKVSGNVAGDRARIVLRSNFDSVAGYVEIQFGTPGQIRILNGDGVTVARSRSFALATNTQHQVKVKAYGTNVIVYIADEPRLASDNFNLLVVSGGLGSGTQLGTIEFDDFELSALNQTIAGEVCPTAPETCRWPIYPDGVPAQLMVVTTGFHANNPNGFCNNNASQCALLNSTYILDPSPTYCTTAGPWVGTTHAPCPAGCYRVTGLSKQCGATTFTAMAVKIYRVPDQFGGPTNYIVHGAFIPGGPEARYMSFAVNTLPYDQFEPPFFLDVIDDNRCSGPPPTYTRPTWTVTCLN